MQFRCQTKHSRIIAILKTIAVDQGDRVPAGKALVKLDNEELEQEVEIAQAMLAASRAGVE